MSKTKIFFILPSKNEESTILELIKNIRNECDKNDFEISGIALADDSTDNTRKIALGEGIEIIIGGGKGLGAAMHKALKIVSQKDCDIIVSMDTDGQVDTSELHSFVSPILKDEADLVLGSRFKEKGMVSYRYPLINRFGIFILVRILRTLTGLNLTDSHGGLRAMRKEVAEELEMIGSHTYVQETIIDAYENGFRIKEITSKWCKRNNGSSRIVGSIPKYIFYTLPILVLRAGQHIKWLYPLGIISILTAFIHISTVAYIENFSLEKMFDRQSFHLFFLLLSTGINLFFFGFIIELVANIKRKLN